MHARMTLKHVMAILIAGLVSACSSGTLNQPKMQEPATNAGPAIQVPLTGMWKGTWEGSGRSQAHGQMEIELSESDGGNVTGRVKVTWVSGTPCSLEWENLSGVKRGERLSLKYNLKERCGNVVLNLVNDPKKNNLLSGTYTSEFPGSGKIRLTRE